MVRIAIASLLVVGTVVAASAQSTSTAPAKTGYQIPGCTHYVIDVNGKMKKVCDRSDTRDAKWFWDRSDRVGGGSSGGQ